MLRFVREEVVSVHKRTHVQPLKAETPMEPYESYRIDFHLFETMFMEISPLAKNNSVNNLAVRLFKVFKMFILKKCLIYHNISDDFFFSLVGRQE